jgi:hypothetical protein
MPYLVISTLLAKIDKKLKAVAKGHLRVKRRLKESYDAIAKVISCA